MPSRPHWDRNQNSRVNSWTHIEEVFLIGAVMTRWFNRGSLAPSREKSTQGDDCWEEIRVHYETKWDEYCKKTGYAVPTPRSATALTRHFKIMKIKLSEPSTTFNLRDYYLEYELKYNFDAFQPILTKFRDEEESGIKDDHASNELEEVEMEFEKRDPSSFSSTGCDSYQNPQFSIGFKRRKPTEAFTGLENSQYYNTVQGADGEKMAKQLQIERDHFRRSLHFSYGSNSQPHLAPHSHSDLMFDEIFEHDFGVNQSFDVPLNLNEELKVPQQQTAVTKQEHFNAQTLPPIVRSSSEQGQPSSLFSLFGLQR